MLEAGHLFGGASIYLRYPVRASISTAGIGIRSVTDGVGVAPHTTTAGEDTVGLGLDTATYSTTQGDLDDGEAGGAGAYRSYSGVDMGRMVTVSVRPDLLVKALISGGATEGTALTTLINTAASSGGTTITDADVGSADMASGTVWCIRGNNVGYGRAIVTHNSSTSFVVTVPFPRAIAVNDEFLFVPYSGYGTYAANIDGFGNVQGTTNLYQADGSIASGTGVPAMVVKLELNGASDSYVIFMYRDHQWNRHTVPA